MSFREFYGPCRSFIFSFAISTFAAISTASTCVRFHRKPIIAGPTADGGRRTADNNCFIHFNQRMIITVINSCKMFHFYKCRSLRGAKASNVCVCVPVRRVHRRRRRLFDGICIDKQGNAKSKLTKISAGKSVCSVRFGSYPPELRCACPLKLPF